MTPDQIDRVFGRGRLKMVTGEHVEVFREAAPGRERRRYTKRFLNTIDADFGQWTEREWRILARLIGHGIDCVPEVVQFDRGAIGGTQLVQTYDAGATVDQWATILPVSREGRLLRHVFEDCAHWWALAHHCLRALFAIHELSVVHLDIKGDNVCIPVGPANFDPKAPGSSLHPRFSELALIDFAFALVSREALTTALPIGWQTDYDYQSPRLLNALEAGRRGDLRPTRELDWRCDMYSLAAMLKRYLPDDAAVFDGTLAGGWSPARAGSAKELILALRDAHDRDSPQRWPHQELMQVTASRLAEDDMASSLAAGWTLARDAVVTLVAASPLTPLTRLAPSIRVMVSPRAIGPITAPPTVIRRRVMQAPPPSRKPRARLMSIAGLVVAAGVSAAVAPWLYERWRMTAENVAPIARAAPDLPPAVPEPSAPPPEPIKPATAAPEPAVPGPAVASSEPQAAVEPKRARAESAPSRAGPPSSKMREARIAVEPRVPVVVASKPPQKEKSVPGRIVVAKPAPIPPRIHPGDPEPAKMAPSAETPQVVAVVPQPPEASPAATIETKPAAPAAPDPVTTATNAAPAPVYRTTTRYELIPEVRSVFTFISNLVKRSNDKAPIEDRALASSPRTPPPTQTPVPPSRIEESAARTDPLRFVPAPVEAMPQFAPLPSPSREPAPRAMPPIEVADFAAQGRRTLAEVLPRSAARNEQAVARVLWVAANANGQDGSVVDAVRTTWSAPPPATAPVAAIARQLSDDARQAFLARRDAAAAFDLQLRAFGANPRDPEVAGNLAFLFLKVNPAQPEMARQVAMHAISVGNRAARADDWQTLAIANALTGRDVEAAHALYVALALTRSLDRTCRVALAAVDSYGDRMIAPVQAMMTRIRQQGREAESTSCVSAARWNTARSY